MAIGSLALMPTLKPITEAVRLAKVSRRLLNQWLKEGRIKKWKIEGDRRGYVDMQEIERLKQPRIVPPGLPALADKPRNPKSSS
jgi:hypothetical protein